MSDPMQTRLRLRTIIARRLGYALDSADTLERFNDEINLAIGALQDDAPEAFDHSEEEVDVLAMFSMADKGVGIKLIPYLSPPDLLNRRVFEIVTADDDTLAGNVDWRPQTDGTWDGRYWLRVRTDSGRSYDVQTREWWSITTAGIPPVTRYYVSIVDPSPFSAASVVTNVVVYQKHIWFPGDTREVKAYPYDTQEGREMPIETISAATAAQTLTDRNDVASAPGEINVIWRDRKFSMPDPIRTPLLHEGEHGQWDTQFPSVQIDACYTIRWGRRTLLVEGERPRGIYEPLWESAPSPVAAINPTENLSGWPSIIFESYNIDALLGFDDNTTLSSYTEIIGRTGLRIAWWIRIRALNQTGGVYTNIPLNDRFYLLTEVQPTDTVTVGGVARYGAYEWDGTAVPDFEVPLVPSVGYYGYGYHGRPDTLTSLRARVRRIPPELTHDYHTVKLKRTGLDALINKVMAEIQRTDGDEAAAVRSEERYNQAAAKVAATEGTDAGTILPGTIGRGTPYYPRAKVTSG